MTLTLDDARARLAKLAAERGDHKAEADESSNGCVYFTEDNEPSCILGHALEAELRALGVDYTHPGNQEAITSYWFRDALKLPAFVAEYLAAAQGEQDSGYSWAQAVRRAETELEAGVLPRR